MKLSVTRAKEKDRLNVFFIGDAGDVVRFLTLLEHGFEVEVKGFCRGYFIIKVKPGTREGWIKILEQINKVESIKEEEGAR